MIIPNIWENKKSSKPPTSMYRWGPSYSTDEDPRLVQKSPSDWGQNMPESETLVIPDPIPPIRSKVAKFGWKWITSFHHFPINMAANAGTPHVQTQNVKVHPDYIAIMLCFTPPSWLVK